MTAPQGGEEPRVVIRDKRRIDPTSGAAPGASVGERMSENDTAAAGQATAQAETAAPAADGGDPATADLARQLAERTEDLQRVTAEYANYRRRVDRDRSLASDQAAERFAVQLFPVIDDIERARDHGDLTGAFKVVADRVLALVEGLGVTAFGVAGDPFDPSLHEAVLHDTSAEVGVPTATAVLRQGFRRGDRVLRTAMVAVSDPEAAPAPSAEAAAPGAGPEAQTGTATSDAQASD